MRAAAGLAALALLCAPAWAVNKCMGEDGRVSFQDAPCPGKGEVLDIRPASGPAQAARPKAPGSAPIAAREQAPAVALPAPAPAMPTRTPLDKMADQCLDWYRPLLRDPASAYHTEPRFEDRRVLRMNLHAKNGFGGMVVREAACEFDNGKFSADWTKIQAKRLNWAVD